MKIPYLYSYRNLWARKLTTLLTAGGMGLVVFVFAAVLMLDAGLQKTLVDTGSYDNAVVTRRGAESEVQSIIDRQQAAYIEAQPEVALGEGGRAMLSKECVVLISLIKRGSETPANVIIRGTSANGLALRPQLKMIAGRMFRPGSNEIVAGRSVAERFNKAGLGEAIRFGGREWVVVGIFDAGKSGFDSEVWGDVDQLMQAFRRSVYSSVIFKLANSDAFDGFAERIRSDPRLTVDSKRETRYYADQSEKLSAFIRYLGLVLSAIFSVGAMIGAMITMFAAVANRVSEIGALRALGFQRGAILIAFLVESLLLAIVGGVVGLIAASFMQFFSISTINFQSFAELAFSFTLTPGIIVRSLIFALVMGLIGGLLPAISAARMNIVDALRAA